MGQYYRAVNVDRAQFLRPHAFGDGAKLMEFGLSGNGLLTALAAMLVMDETHKGQWAGERIVIAGDYADEGKFVPPEHAEMNLYSYASGDDSPYREMTDEANAQVARLGLPKLRSEADEGPTDSPVYSRRVFDQPEDLGEALFARPQENVKAWLEEMMMTLRMTQVPSSVAWCQVRHAELKIDPETGRALSLDCAFENDRMRDVPRYLEHELHFPCTAKAVRAFFSIKPLPKPKQLPNEAANGPLRLTA